MNVGLIVANAGRCRNCISILGKWHPSLTGTGIGAQKWIAPTPRIMSTQPNEAKEDFFERNERLNRPMSPHLTIYKFQITSVLSITHRFTGLALSGMSAGLALGMLVLPGTFPYYMSMLQAAHYGPACIFMAKFIISFPFLFHLSNGIRHLAWDFGKGFKIKEVYTSGYAVVGASLALALLVSSISF